MLTELFRKIHGIFMIFRSIWDIKTSNTSIQYFYSVLFCFADFLTLWRMIFFSFDTDENKIQRRQNSILSFQYSTIFEWCMVNAERETEKRNKSHKKAAKN